MPHYYVADARNSTQHYRNDIIEWRRRILDISAAEIARQAGINELTARNVLRGTATGRNAYPVAKILGLDWEKLHNFDLQESDFHLAISKNGNGSHLAR